MDETTNQVAQPTLRSLAESRDFSIGAAVAAAPLRDEPAYASTIAREFNMLTPENALKFGPLSPSRGVYDFDAADAIVEFARSHSMKVRGHTLVWHMMLPAWLTEGTFAPGELRTILHDHIFTVAGRYRGQIAAWDVVNEAIADDGSLRDSIWLRAIGPEYIALAFQWAHEADPGARLFYNDYGGEGLGTKSDAIYRLVQDLLQRGLPVHGVGLQMHIGLQLGPQPQELAENMRRLGALGLQIQITELDVKIQDGSGSLEKRFAKQAQIYGDLMTIALSEPNCSAYVLWGFTDRHSWIPHFTGHPDAALIFDAAYHPKPAYFAIKDALARSSEVHRGT